MLHRDLHKLLDALRQTTDEAEWVEFKEAKTSFDTEKVGQYFAALANEANLKGRHDAWLILGVHDSHRDAAGRRVVVGTDYRRGAAAQNELKKYVADHTPYRTTFREIHELTVDGKRVLMLQIPSASPGIAVTWKGHLYGREGSSIGSLSLAELDQIRGQNNDWSAEVLREATLADLDSDAVALARKAFKTKHPKLAAEADDWDDKTFLNKARVTRSGAVTRTALLLLGKPEAAHMLSPADPRMTWVLKHSDGTDRDSHHYLPPFIVATSELAGRIRNTPYQFMRDSTLFPDQFLQYDPWVLREILHNCVAHQDYTLNGRISVVEREDSLTFTNLGAFIPGSVINVINADSPPDRYRNRLLANAMVELNMIDTLGSGIPKSFRIQRARGFPLPDFEFDSGHRVVVMLLGKVLDENYTRTLLAKTDLPLPDVIALDKVQK
ncbi:MAG: RNA-binding domain-containing protein, partial [Hyphomicrobiaceae bacterium]